MHPLALAVKHPQVGTRAMKCPMCTFVHSRDAFGIFPEEGLPSVQESAKLGVRTLAMRMQADIGFFLAAVSTASL